VSEPLAGRPAPCLGLDVGGTRGRFEWWPAGSAPGGDADGVQPAVHGVERTVEQLARVLQDATRRATPAAAVCALAGAGERATADAIASGLAARGVAFPVAIVGDVVAAAAAALAHGPGVAVWAGTGSFALARGQHGELFRVGGRGFLLGDQGSGYDFVRRAAVAALLAADGMGPPTALGDALAGAFDAPAVERLGAVLQRLDPRIVAARLPVVLDVAADGDAVANAVLDAGVEELARLADAAVRRAALAWPALAVSLGGGVLTGAAAVRERVMRALGSRGALPATVVGERAAAVGAAWLAHGWHHGEEPQRGWVQRVAI
jgi:N-acetylglucosamine kinase-like BadF-type ATPase